MTGSEHIRNGLYRHYKGKMYRVLGEARHSETNEMHVLYRALYGEYGLFIRPKSMFLETVDQDGQTVPRFEYLEAQGDEGGERDSLNTL